MPEQNGYVYIKPIKSDYCHYIYCKGSYNQDGNASYYLSDNLYEYGSSEVTLMKIAYYSKAPEVLRCATTTWTLEKILYSTYIISETASIEIQEQINIGADRLYNYKYIKTPSGNFIEYIDDQPYAIYNYEY